MKLCLVFGVLGLLLVPRLAAAAPTHALTDLDDARACQPLEGGGLAVATGGGLVVVANDGRVSALTALDGLPDTRVHAVAQDGDSLWVGTEGGAALVALTPTPKVTRAISVADAPVRAVLPTASGVYLGTWGSGLLVLPAGSAVERVPAQVPGKRVTALSVHAGSLYAAYDDGPLGRLERGVLRRVVAEPAHGQALASVATSDGPSLVLGALEGLFRVSDGGTSIASVDARALASSGTNLLVATYGSGLLVGTTRGELRRDAGVPRFVRGVAVRGSVRCAATTEGVFVDDAEHSWKKVALGGLPSNDVTALATIGARVAVGTFDAGAAIAEAGEFHRVPGIEPSGTVNAISWQGKGAGARLLLGTAHGLVRVEPDGSVRRFRVDDGLPSPVVRAILVLDEERVLVGTDDGSVMVEGDRVTPLVEVPKGGPRALASPMRATWALVASDDGTLWIGTTAGLYYGKGSRFRRAALATGELADDWVTALASRGHDIFVGTYSGGVTRLRVNGDGLEATQLGGGYVNPCGLTIAGGALYASTMEGLLVRAADDDHAAWQLRSDLSPGRDVTAVRVEGDHLWVASRRGIGLSTLTASAASPNG